MKGVIAMAVEITDYKHLKFPTILEYCKENAEAAKWLKSFAAKKLPTMDYPLKEDGTPDKKADKVPTGEEHTPTFLEIKYYFCKEFFPAILPKAKAKEPTIYDLIAAL
jgi:hypothetical protein